MSVDASRVATVVGYLIGELNLINDASLLGFLPDGRATIASAIQTMAQQTIVAEVARADGIPNVSVDTALAQLSYSMRANSQTFQSNPATLTITGIGSPTGTPKFVTTDLDSFGSRSDIAIPENITLRATSGTTLSVVGQHGPDDALAVVWPEGSGTSTTMTLVDTTLDGGLVTNGAFANWSGSPLAADNWTIPAGDADVWGTGFARVTDDPFTGSDGYSLRVTSAGALQRLVQPVTVQTGTSYAIHAFIKKVVGTGGTGTVSVTLRDQTGATLSSQVGINQTFSATTTSWVAYSGVAYVPRQLSPTTTVYVELRWTGTAADSFNIGNISVQPFTPLYDGGPSIVGFAGVTPLVLDTDAWTLAVSGAATTTSFMASLNRLTPLTSTAWRLPTSGSPTYADSVIQ